MKEGSTLAVADTIKDILGSTCVRAVSSNRMASVQLVIAKASILLIDEDVPRELQVLYAFAFIHRHV